MFAIASSAVVINLCAYVLLLLELNPQGKFLGMKLLGQKLNANVILLNIVKLLSTRVVPIHNSTRVPETVHFLKTYKGYFKINISIANMIEKRSLSSKRR